jgi:crotonobetainyl-CoA:carnitine CoA-transferase CaiB-like acyl-CoA transferase
MEVTELFKSRTMREWSEFGQAVDCCLTPILETEELKDFPLYKRTFEKNLSYPAIKMHGGLKSEVALPPKKGEHTEEVLTKIAGISAEKIKSMKKEKEL